MSDAVAAPAAAPAKVATPKKAKATKPKAPKKASTHPSYQEMVKKAIETLKERGGSSRQAIQKYIMANFKTCDDKKGQAQLRLALKRGVAAGVLQQAKGTGAAGSFRLGEKAKAVAKPKAVKKKVAKKPAGEKKVKKATKPKTPKKAKAAADGKPKTPKVKAAKKPKKPAAEKKASKPKVAKKPKTPKKAGAAKPKAPKAKKPAAKKAAPAKA